MCTSCIDSPVPVWEAKLVYRGLFGSMLCNHSNPYPCMNMTITLGVSEPIFGEKVLLLGKGR